jgi:hypothetical protein
MDFVTILMDGFLQKDLTEVYVIRVAGARVEGDAGPIGIHSQAFWTPVLRLCNIL